LILDDEMFEAIQILGPVAFDPHGGEAAAMAQQLIIQALGGEAPAATAPAAPSLTSDE